MAQFAAICSEFPCFQYVGLYFGLDHYKIKLILQLKKKSMGVTNGFLETIVGSLSSYYVE